MAGSKPTPATCRRGNRLCPRRRSRQWLVIFVRNGATELLRSLRPMWKRRRRNLPGKPVNLRKRYSSRFLLMRIMTPAGLLHPAYRQQRPGRQPHLKQLKAALLLLHRLPPPDLEPQQPLRPLLSPAPRRGRPMRHHHSRRCRHQEARQHPAHRYHRRVHHRHQRRHPNRASLQSQPRLHPRRLHRPAHLRRREVPHLRRALQIPHSITRQRPQLQRRPRHLQLRLRLST